MVTFAPVIGLHWEETPTAVHEATLEVEHTNGDRQLFVVQVLRMTSRVKWTKKKPKKAALIARRNTK